MPSPTSPSTTAWHGRFQIPLDSMGRWSVGPMTLWIQRLQGEWRIAQQTLEDPLAQTLEVQVPAEVEDLLTRETCDRFALLGDDTTITLAPSLADRPVVARPEKPFHLPPNEEVQVFVGSPLWLKILAGSPQLLLLDRPIFRPSDTWFGPSTMEGELCYASRTHLKLSLDSVLHRPHRALTAVRIRNRSGKLLHIESLKLPVTHLALYQGSWGQLWTQDITFRHERDSDSCALQLPDDPPCCAQDAVRLAQPRLEVEDNAMMRVFNAIFS